MNTSVPTAFRSENFASPITPPLDPGEKLIWSGQPRQGVRLQASDFLLVPFSLMWGGFSIFWEANALGLVNLPNARHQAIPAFFALWGLPFVAIGLYMILGRFFVDAAIRRKTWYAITDRRLVIFQGLFPRRVTSYDFASLANLNLVERPDQSGDILFGLPGPMNSMTGAGLQMGRGGYRVPGFYLLPAARSVFTQIQSIQQQNGRGSRN